jgi:hypothetical protein
LRSTKLLKPEKSLPRMIHPNKLRLSGTPVREVPRRKSLPRMIHPNKLRLSGTPVREVDGEAGRRE